MVKNPPANVGDTRDVGSIPRLGRSPGVGPTPVFLPGKFHGQRSLVGYKNFSEVPMGSHHGLIWGERGKGRQECSHVLLLPMLEFVHK